MTKLAEYDTMLGEGKDKMPSVKETEMNPTPTSTATLEPEGKLNPQGGKVVKYSWQLSKTVMADVVITGPAIGATDIEMLRKYLELTKSALTDVQPQHSTQP